MIAYAMSMEINRVVNLVTGEAEAIGAEEFESLLMLSLAAQMAIVQWRGKDQELMAAASIGVRRAALASVAAHATRPGGGVTVAARSLLDGIRLEMEQETGSLLPMPELKPQPWLGFAGR